MRYHIYRTITLHVFIQICVLIDFFYISRYINKPDSLTLYFRYEKVKLHIRYPNDFPFLALVFSLKTDSDTLSNFMKKIRFSDLYRMLFSLIYKLTNFPDGIDER